MRFRLTYNGPLKVTKHDGDGPMHTNKRAEHQHSIRREFHKQLKEYWRLNRFLSEHKMDPKASKDILPPIAAGALWAADPTTRRPMADVLADLYRRGDYRFVPLVREEISLSCSLRVLFLRRDWPNSVLTAGDIDNRIKTLVDALKIPTVAPGKPEIGEDPFFVLLDDDRRVTHLEVETDAALLASEDDPKDQSYARLVITVDIRPIDVTMFNLSFA